MLQKNAPVSERKALVNFVNDLEQHQHFSKHFFDDSLLDIIDKNFKLMNISITAYDGPRFIDAISRNKAFDLYDYYKTDYNDKDYYSKYISSNTSKLLKNPHAVVSASRLEPLKEYFDTDYLPFLKRAGLKSVATMVFHRHRINIYKDVEQDDFSEGEIDFYADIYSLISSKYDSFLLNQKSKITNQSKSKFLDSNGVGFLAFDDKGNALECNSHGLKYATTIFNHKYISQIFTDIVALFDDEASEAGSTMSRIYKEHVISMNTVFSIDNFGMVHKYYYVSVSKTMDQNIPDPNIAKLFSTLTSRELEVLDAFCNGDNYHDIAKNLFISEHTVHYHLKSIYRKLDVTNQRLLVRMYCQYSLTAQANAI